MKEWTADVITDEENKQFIEEMRIRNNENNGEDFEFDSSLFDNESLGITDIHEEVESVDVVKASIVNIEKMKDIVTTKPYAEDSVRAPLDQINTPEVVSKSPEVIDNEKMDNMVYSWESVDTEKDVIISFIQGVYCPDVAITYDMI